MKFKPYIFYGTIEMTSVSPMHLGGEEKDDLVKDGQDEYMMPASSIAGAIKHVIHDPLLGKEGEDTVKSDVYFYDAALTSASVERRTGIARDGRFGTAKEGALYSTFYISEGVKTTLKMQMFLDEEQHGHDLFTNIVQNIQNKTITFGAKRSHGAGMFDVTKTSYRVLDLHNAKDFKDYCKGVNTVFNTVKAFTVEDKMSEREIVYDLKAIIDGPLLVKSDIVPEAKNEKQHVADAQNMFKMVNNKKIYFIPGSTIKGLVRSYATMVCNHQNIDLSVIDEIFGGEVNGVKTASKISFSDVEIKKPQFVIYHRIPIDRWLGGTIEGQKLDIEAISSNEPVSIKVRIRKDLDERQSHIAHAFVYLTLRDLGNGLLTIGSYDSIGFGRFAGESLSIDNKVCPFKDHKVECGSLAQELMEHLKVLEEESR